MRSKVPQLDWNSYLQCKKRIWSWSALILCIFICRQLPDSALFHPPPPLDMFFCCFCSFAGGRRQPGCGRAFGEVTPAHSRRLWSGGGDGVPHHYWSRYQRKSPITCCVPGGIPDEQLPLFSHQWFAFRQDLARCFTKFQQSFLTSAFFISIFFWRSHPRNVSVAMCWLFCYRNHFHVSLSTLETSQSLTFTMIALPRLHSVFWHH